MINRESFFRAGNIKKAFGVRGELIFLFHKETEIELNQKEPVFPELDGNLVPFFIEHCYWHTPTEARIKLEDVNNKDEAEKLAGFSFFLPLKKLSNRSDELKLAALEGFQVIDEESGDLGIIKELIENPGQVLILVISEEKEVLIPLVEEFIIAVDPRQKQIITHLPEGLININE